MESIFDLPSHALFLHAPIVLVPLAFIVSLAMVRRVWRRQYRVPLVALTAASVVTTYIARESGEEFDELLQGAVDIDRHASFANWTMVFVVLMFVASVVLLVLDRRLNPAIDAAGDRGATTGALSSVVAITIVLGLLGTIWMVRTGHEGSKLVWSGTVQTE